MSDAAEREISAATVNWPQVRTILWARWRIWFRHATSNWKRALGAVLGIVFTFALIAVVCALAFGAMVMLRRDRETAASLLHAGMGTMFLMLVLSPMLGLRSNEFLDVTKLFLLPVSHRTVFAATLFGLATSMGTLFLVLPLCVGAVVFAGASSAAVPAVLAVLLVAACGLAIGHGALLLWLDFFRSRRWRDFSIVLLTVVGAGIYGWIRISATGDITRSDVTSRIAGAGGFFRKLVFLPSWWGAHAITGESALRWLPALALVALLVWTVRAAARVQERVYHGEIEERPIDIGVRRGLPAKAGRFWRGAVGASLEKDLALLFRDPAVRIYLVQHMSYSVVPFLAIVIQKSDKGPSLPELAPWISCAGYFVVLLGCAGLCLNPLGTEGAGIAHTLQTPVRRGDILRAKATALTFLTGGVGAALAVAATIGTGLVAGTPPAAIAGYAARGALETLCAAAILSGVGAFAGSIQPRTTVQRQRRALGYAQQPKGGCLSTIVGFAGFCAAATCMAPLFFLFHHPALLARADVDSSAWLGMSIPLGVVWSWAILRLGALAGGPLLAAREESILAEMTRPQT